MKKLFWGLGLVVMGVGLFGLGWISHGVSGNAPVVGHSPSNPAPTSVSPSNAPATQNTASSNALVSQSEFEQLRNARNAVLQANPDLAAEYKELLNESQAQQAKFDAAMIKADPKVAPIIAKLVALRQINGGHAQSAVAGPR